MNTYVSSVHGPGYGASIVRRANGYELRAWHGGRWVHVSQHSTLDDAHRQEDQLLDQLRSESQEATP